MTLALELWDEPELQRCPDCRGSRRYFSGEVLDASQSVAAFMTYLYDHGGVREVFTDVIFGTWGDDAVDDDHVTFGSRTGPIEGFQENQSSLVQGGEMAPGDAAMLGERLSREQALGHPLLPLFWQVNDVIVGEIGAVGANWEGVGRRRTMRDVRQRRTG